MSTSTSSTSGLLSTAKKHSTPPFTKEEIIKYAKEKRKQKTRELQRRKRQDYVKSREHELSQLTPEQRQAWKERKAAQEAEQEQALIDAVKNGQRIAVDVNYQESMSNMEQISLVKQLCFAYNANKKGTKHISLHICGASPDSNQYLKNVKAERWKATFHDDPLERVFSPSELVYLSPDAQEPLLSLDPSKVYVIGGLVDRTINKNQSAIRATELGIPSYRLPIREFYPDCAHPILNINAVVEILIGISSGKSWEDSLREAIPSRKVHSKEKMREEFNYRRIRTEKQLLEIPVRKIPQFNFRNILSIRCVKLGKKLEWQSEEHNVKVSDESRFTTKAIIDGEVAGVGEGSSIRFAASYAAWRALEWLGVYREEEPPSSKE